MNLNILPLMMEYEINDIIFFVKCMKKPSPHFNISDFVSFSSSTTRSSTYHKLRHSISSNNKLGHFYLNRLPRLWNSLPCLDIDLSITSIKTKLRDFFWNHFILNFSVTNTCTYHYLCPCRKCSKLPVSLPFSRPVL